MLGGQRQQRVEEGGEALARRRPGPERRRAVQELLLQAALGLVDQRLGEARTIAEAVEDRALGHAGLARDVAHGHGLDAALGEQPPRRLEHPPRLRAASARSGRAWSAIGSSSIASDRSTELDPGQVRASNLTAVNLIRRPSMEILVVPLLLLVGSLLSLQAGANVQLASATRSPFGASALQLGLGAVLLLALAAVLGTLGSLDLVDDVEAWHLLGGLGSAVYITAGILLFPRLGAIVSVGLFVAGQTLVSLLLDLTGWLGVPAAARRPGRWWARSRCWSASRWSCAPRSAAARPPGLDRARARRRRRAAGPGRDQRPVARRPRRADRRRRLELRDRGRGDAARAHASRVAPRPAARAAPAGPVVGLARRAVRRDLRDLGVPADPGDRRRRRRSGSRSPASRSLRSSSTATACCGSRAGRSRTSG